VLLSSRWVLHEVTDVEAVCASTLNRSGLQLSHADREDCLAFLLETAWKLSLAYDAGGRESRFGVYLSRKLNQRLVDWQRSRNGRTRWQFKDRTYERKLPELVSLDADGDSLGSALASDGSGPEDGRYECESGLERERNRQRLRDLELLGLRPDRRGTG
jgi:hypothetical protein